MDTFDSDKLLKHQALLTHEDFLFPLGLTFSKADRREISTYAIVAITKDEKIIQTYQVDPNGSDSVDFSLMHTSLVMLAKAVLRQLEESYAENPITPPTRPGDLPS